MCFMFFRPPTGCFSYRPCQPTAPRMRRPMRMEEEYYMEEDMDYDYDEMEEYEMEHREGMDLNMRSAN